MKTLCMHIRPEAYVDSKPDATSTDFAASIEAQLGRPLTPEERVALNLPDSSTSVEGSTPSYEDDVDVIERA